MVAVFVARLGTALILGSAIGLERQWRQRMAGLRTNALVASGAAMFVALQTLTPGDSSATRIAAQVVSGIGFLGAGVIMRDGFNVRGLNTAATLWCAAAVGTLAGAGYLVHASVSAAAALVINLALRPMALRINQQPPLPTSEVPTLYRLTARIPGAAAALIESSFQPLIREGLFTLRGLQREPADEAGDVSFQVDLSAPGRDDARMEDLVTRLILKTGFVSATWRAMPDESSQ
jgi:putative Mg2+ transporter-C (MgtC) family protein